MNWILDTSEYVPRMHCGNWPIWLIVVFITANWSIAVAYYMIPCTLFYFWKKKRLAVKKHWIILLFCTFIFMCGTTHVLEGLMFWWPAYRFLTLVDIVTAYVSLLTAIMLIPVVRYKMLYKTSYEYELLQIELHKKIEEEEEMLKNIRVINHDLANRVQYLEYMVAERGWITKEQLKLHELKTIVHNFRSQYRERSSRG